MFYNYLCILGHNIHSFNGMGQEDKDICLVRAAAEFNIHNSREQSYREENGGFFRHDTLDLKQEKSKKVKP